MGVARKGGVFVPKVLKILLTILAVLLGLVLVFFIASRIAGYTMAGLWDYLTDYLKYIWNDRIFG